MEIGTTLASGKNLSFPAFKRQHKKEDSVKHALPMHPHSTDTPCSL